MFQRCREVDPSGPLATLRRLLLSDESIAGFKRWVLNHWYAVLLILLAVIALLVSRIFCNIHTFIFCLNNLYTLTFSRLTSDVMDPVIRKWLSGRLAIETVIWTIYVINF